MRNRKLSLKKETLVELTQAQLGSVAAGAATTKCTASALTCQGPCYSDFMECITGLRCVSVNGC